MRPPFHNAASFFLLSGVLLWSQGCSSGPEEDEGVKEGLVAPGGMGPIASIRTISYDDMIARAKDAMELGRFRAASQYFGAALTVRPYSDEAREGLAHARYNAARKQAPDSISAAEGALPPPPPDAMSGVDDLIRKMEEESGAGEEEDIQVFGRDEEEEPGPIREGILNEETDPSLTPRFPSEEKGERPSIKRPSLTTWIGIPSLMPCRPLRTGRNNLFHVLLHIPPMEAARTLGAKVWSVESGYDGSVGHLTHGSYGHGLFIRYDMNRYDEGYVKLAHGLSDFIEARLELTLGNLREGDYDVYLSDGFTHYIEPYDRSGDLGNVLLGLKTRLYMPFKKQPETGVTSEISLKIPAARNPENFTTSGMPDLAVQLAGTVDLFKFVPWPRVVPSVCLGVTIPFGEIYFAEDVDLDPVFFFGLGSVVQLDNRLALVGQIQGNTSAFGEFSPLADMVLTSHVGIRVMLGNFIIEAGFGHGFTETSSNYVISLNIGFAFEGAELFEEILR